MVEGVELLVQAVLGRDGGVEAAAWARLSALGLHGEAAFLLLTRPAARATVVRAATRRRWIAPSLVDSTQATSEGATRSEPPPLRPASGERSDFAVLNPQNRWPFNIVP